MGVKLSYFFATRRIRLYHSQVGTWIQASVSRRHEWAEGLSTIAFDVVPQAFTPGQFVNIALTDAAGVRTKRAYSLASAPGEPAELFVTLVPDGKLTPRLFSLPIGGAVELDAKPAGVFTLEDIPDANRDLWLVSTGTGLGPYISMFRTPGLMSKFERIVVVHGVRMNEHLAYRAEIEALGQELAPRVDYVPLVTREAPPVGGLQGRIPQALATRQIQRLVGGELEPGRSHVLLCGNPDMVKDAAAVLDEMGLAKHSRRKPGNITKEKYW